MGKKKKVSKRDIELALLIEEMLDYVPTDLKYNSTINKFLLKTLGHEVITGEDIERYEEISDSSLIIEDPLYNGIPSYICEEDIMLWEASKITYEATKNPSRKESYPEAFSEPKSRQYTKNKTY